MKGILFKPDMIRAIIEGRKTQTRRVIKNPEKYDNIRGCDFCAPYQVGDVVYIKEGLGRELMPNILTGEPTDLEHAYYLVDHEPVVEKLGFDLVPWWEGKTLSPLHLSADVARYFIKITDVRPERLQEITEKDAGKEGFNYWEYNNPDSYADFPCTNQFIQRWNSINPKHPWASNPWCFVYTFQLVDKLGGEVNAKL